MFSFASKLFRLLTAALVVVPVSAHAVTWTAEGPGQLEIIENGNTVTFNYDLDVSRTYGMFEWVLTGRGFEPDRHVFEWAYRGEHDNKQSHTIVKAPDITLVQARSGTGAFSYTGDGFVIENDRRDDFRFRMFATNDDITQSLKGSLEITAVPVPAPALLLSVALVGSAAALGRRRNKTKADQPS